jgi:hypothetical protein
MKKIFLNSVLNFVIIFFMFLPILISCIPIIFCIIKDNDNILFFLFIAIPFSCYLGQNFWDIDFLEKITNFFETKH